MIGHLFFSLSDEAIEADTCAEYNGEVAQINQVHGVLKKEGVVGFHGGEESAV